MTKLKETFTFGATGTTTTDLPVSENGMIRAIIATVANFTNSVTATVYVLDDEDNIIYTSSALTKGVTTLISSLAVPLDYKFKLRVTLSGNAGGTGGAVVVKPFIESLK